MLPEGPMELQYRTLEQLLLEQGRISADDLRKVKRLQQERGERLERLLLDLGFISEEDLLPLLAVHLGVESRKETLDAQPRDPTSLKAVHGLPGFSAMTTDLDAGDPAQVRASVDEALGRLGGLDILVNNAGVGAVAGVLETPLETYDAIMDVNVRGPFLYAQACFPYLEATGGCMLHVSSDAGVAGEPLHATPGQQEFLLGQRDRERLAARGPHRLVVGKDLREPVDERGRVSSASTALQLGTEDLRATLQEAAEQREVFALGERLVYDEAGQLLTGSLMDYPLPAAADLPSFTLGHLETPSPLTPGGRKGMGEGGTIGAPAAIANAVADAVKPLGIGITALPILPATLVRSTRDPERADRRLRGP